MSIKLTKLQEQMLRCAEGRERERFLARVMDYRVHDFLEAFGTSDYANLVVDAAHVKAQKEWEQAGGIWRDLVTIGPGATDFKPDNFLSAGNFAPLGVVKELAMYPMVNVSDQKVTLQVQKRGAIFATSMEARINESLKLLGGWASKFVKAANEALEQHVVYTMIDQNPTIYDSVALYHNGTHKNDVGNANGYTRAELILAISKMYAQTGLGGNKITVQPKILLVPPDKYVEAMEDVSSMEKLALAGTASAPTIQGSSNALRNLDLKVVTSPWLSTSGATDNAFYLFGDPKKQDGLLVEFLGGREAPELFSEVENSGFSFEHDAIRNKVRHVWGSAWLDYRTTVRGGV